MEVSMIILENKAFLGPLGLHPTGQDGHMATLGHRKLKRQLGTLPP